MTYGRKTGGKNFKPGNKLSKGKGRPRVSAELKAARELGRPLVEERVFELKHKTEKAAHEILQDPETKLEDKLILRVILRGVAKGDYQCLGFITDFIFGKRPDKIEVKSDTNHNFESVNKTKIKTLLKEIEDEY